MIDERLRGTGLGRRLMDATLARAWNEGCYKAMLMTGRRTRPPTRSTERRGSLQTRNTPTSHVRSRRLQHLGRGRTATKHPISVAQSVRPSSAAPTRLRPRGGATESHRPCGRERSSSMSSDPLWPSAGPLTGGAVRLSRRCALSDYSKWQGREKIERTIPGGPFWLPSLETSC